MRRVVFALALAGIVPGADAAKRADQPENGFFLEGCRLLPVGTPRMHTNSNYQNEGVSLGYCLGVIDAVTSTNLAPSCFPAQPDDATMFDVARAVTSLSDKSGTPVEIVQRAIRQRWGC